MRRHRVEYPRSAALDRGGLGDLLVEAGASRKTARGYVKRIRARREELGDVPLGGTARDDLLPGLRTAGFERRVPITCRVGAGRVRVANVLYGGRDVDASYRRERTGDDA